MKSKLIAFGLILSVTMTPCIAFASHKTKETAEQSKAQGYKTIDAKELKSWIDSGKEMQIVDARPKKFEGGDVLPGAKFLPYDSDANAIAKALPNKDIVIVTYCASLKCPASSYLSDQLVQLGYKSVYKYPGGIADWYDKGYPTKKSK